MIVDTTSEQHRRECEARHALSMTDQKRQAYYQGVKDKRGQNGLDSLVEEVMKQEAIKVLSQDHAQRRAYYQKVADERGDNAAHELVARVKRQRKMDRGMEM